MPEASEFEQIANHAGIFDRFDRCRLAITGTDRAKFLHNLLTNEIKRLPLGKGCEAFVTSTQGRTLAFVTALADVEMILLRSDAAAAEALLPHLRKYGVFDEVAIEDQSASTFEYHLAGPSAAEIVRRCGGQLPEEVELAHLRTEVGGHPVQLIRESLTTLAGLTLVGELARAQSLKASFLEAGRELGLVDASTEAFDVLRIEAGTPVYGNDITDKNLPQEIGRDDRAISFVKGCYLGQETVARLDALGHVNQMLRGLVIEPGSPTPEPGAAVEGAGKRIGAITSSAFSPVRNAAIALAIIRTSHMAAGTNVEIVVRDGEAKIAAVVSDFPLGHPTRGSEPKS